VHTQKVEVDENKPSKNRRYPFLSAMEKQARVVWVDLTLTCTQYGEGRGGMTSLGHNKGHMSRGAVEVVLKRNKKISGIKPEKRGRRESQLPILASQWRIEELKGGERGEFTCIARMVTFALQAQEKQKSSRGEWTWTHGQKTFEAVVLRNNYFHRGTRRKGLG